MVLERWSALAVPVVRFAPRITARCRVASGIARRGLQFELRLCAEGDRMKHYTKKEFPVSDVRRFMEPGPIVLVSSAWKGKSNIMTMGWHMVMEFVPSLIGCYIWSENHSFDMVLKSRCCVINLPTLDLAPKVVEIGNSSGREIDKFAANGLTAEPARKVGAPLIRECYANFECKLVDSSMVRKRSFFILEVVHAHVATAPKFPKTIHYRGDGIFMIAGTNTARYRKLFRPDKL